jgi:hypothetical protein
MANGEYRVYFVIDASATRTLAQWNMLAGACDEKPLIAAIILAARHTNKPHNNISRVRFSVDPPRRYLLCEFEVDRDDLPAIKNLVDSEIVRRGITGQTGYPAKFTALLQAELREACVDLGYPTLAPLLSVSLWSYGAQATAIGAAFDKLYTVIDTWQTAL